MQIYSCLCELLTCPVVVSQGAIVINFTQAGLELRPIVELLGAWGHRWAKSDLSYGDLDTGLLMWDMRRSIDASIFPDRKIVGQFEYPDAPKGTNVWWLIMQNGEVDLCLNDPGYEVDLLIRASLAIKPLYGHAKLSLMML